MANPKEPLPKVPPFFERKSTPVRNKVDTRGMLSVATMFVSLATLTGSLLGGAKLVFDIFNEGLAASLDGLLVKAIVLGFAFLFGWVVGLASIRVFGNLVYPIIIHLYLWVCLAAVSVMYLKVIEKLYIQRYDSVHFWAYLTMLLGGLSVLICLHLLIEDHDLRPFAIPLLIISVLQLFAIIFRYVFTSDANGIMLFGDFAIFTVMVSISALMLMHLGVLRPLRNQIHNWFAQNGDSNHNGNNAE